MDLIATDKCNDPKKASNLAGDWIASRKEEIWAEEKPKSMSLVRKVRSFLSALGTARARAIVAKAVLTSIKNWTRHLP
eukprot:6485235-Karenia_brevis.AAC.1